MTKLEFIEYLSKNNKFGSKSTEKSIKFRLPKIHDEIIQYNIDYFNDADFSWKQKLFHFIENIINIPKCKNENCQKNVNFDNVRKKYNNFCSNYCAQSSQIIIDRKKQTTLKNHGVEYPMQNELVKVKSKNKCKLNYGVDNPSKSNTIQAKKIKTNQLKYGVDSYSKTDEFKIKLRSTNDKRIAESFLKRIDNDNISIENVDLLNIKVINYCPLHSEFIISKDLAYGRINLKHENICNVCNPTNESRSIKEIEISKFINELNINHSINDKNILNGLELDIYIPEYNLAIEHDGIYYHSSLFKDKKYHLNKTELCEKKQIQLLHVFEDEWITKKEIVKSIIKSKLNIGTNKIFARKCEILEINNNKLIKEFLNKNHIQGFVGSSVKFGLFFNGELVSLMTFGKKRKALGSKSICDNEYELLRYCSKLNTKIIGGASKLLKHFIKNYNPKSILTYADRRYSQGKLYVDLGFKFIKNTEPNYWYIHSHTYIKYHRFRFRKDVLVKMGFDSTKTESEIMKGSNYKKLYDCGSMKFELKLRE